MQYDEFAKTVQAVANMDSKQQAERAIKAALETLSERILGDEASHLAAQLPGEIGTYLRSREGQGGERFSLEEFYRRISDREGVDGQTAATHAKAVFSTLNVAVTPEEFNKIKSILPPDYKDLFAPQGI